jgi:PKD repeat protein
VTSDFSFTTPVLIDQQVSFTNLSQNATDYQWAFGDGDTSTEVNPSHTYSGSSGDHTVTLTASNLCDSAVMNQLVSVEDYAVTVTPSLLGGDPGTTVYHSLRVTNTGTLSDVYQLTVSADDWTTVLSTDTLTLEAGEGETVVMQVTVPADARGGDQDTAFLTALSLSDPRDEPASDRATVVTTANTIYALALGPAASAGSARPGETVVYSLRITNTGNIVDTFTFSRTVDGWPTEFSVPSMMIAPGGARSFEAMVTVPDTATDGEWETAVIRATGDENYQEVQLTTTSVWFRVYLPLTLKE